MSLNLTGGNVPSIRIQWAFLSCSFDFWINLDQKCICDLLLGGFYVVLLDEANDPTVISE